MSVIGWPGGPNRSLSIIQEVRTGYFIWSICFLAIETTIISISLVTFKYQKAKFLKFIGKLNDNIAALNHRLRVFFQILCSLNFAISLFAAGQTLATICTLKTDIFSYFDTYSLPLNETGNAFWIVWMEGWNLFYFYWLFYVSISSGIFLLIAIFFSDTEIIPKKARIPFIFLKISTLIILFIEIFYFPFITKITHPFVLTWPFISRN